MKISILSTLITICCLTFSFGAFDRGLRLYEEGDFEKAIQAFEIEAIYSETGAVRHNLGVTHFQNGNPAEAIWNMERATLLNPDNDAYRFKLDALREQVGLPPIKLSLKERFTSLLHHDDWMRTFAYFALTALAAYFFPIAAGWKHNRRVRILIIFCAIGTVFSGIGFAQARAELKRGVSLTDTPTELHAAPAKAAPQTGLIRTGERAHIVERHKDFLRLQTEGGASGWLHQDSFRKIR